MKSSKTIICVLHLYLVESVEANDLECIQPVLQDHREDHPKPPCEISYNISLSRLCTAFFIIIIIILTSSFPCKRGFDVSPKCHSSRLHDPVHLPF